MSWNLNIIGRSEDVSDAASKDPHLPQSLKDVVAAYAEAGRNAPVTASTGFNSALHLETAGHFDRDSAWGNVDKFVLRRVTLVGPVPAPPASAA